MTTTSPGDWFQQFYQASNLTGQSTATPSTATVIGGRVLDSTVVSTTKHNTSGNASSPNINTHSFVHLENLTGSGSNIISDSLASSITATTTSITSGSTVTGRVSKPARRRSRASRKNPITLLNTDAKNFRAMVQRFTGGAGAGSGTATYDMPVYSSSGFNLSQGQGQGQIGNFNHQGGGSSFMLGMGMGMYYPNPSVVAGVDQSHLHHRQILLPQQYMLSNSSMAQIGGGASSRTLDRGVLSQGLGAVTEEEEKEAAANNPSLRAVSQVSLAKRGGSSDYLAVCLGGGENKSGSFMF